MPKNREKRDDILIAFIYIYIKLAVNPYDARNYFKSNVYMLKFESFSNFNY